MAKLNPNDEVEVEITVRETVVYSATVKMSRARAEGYTGKFARLQGSDRDDLTLSLCEKFKVCSPDNTVDFFDLELDSFDIVSD